PLKGTRTLTVSNLGNTSVTAQLDWATKPGLTITGPSSVTVPAHGQATVSVAYAVDVTRSLTRENELDGFGTFSTNGGAAVHVPVLAVALRGAGVAVDGVNRSGANVDVQLSNAGSVKGEVLAFDLLGQDEVDTSHRNGACDLAFAGYRVV